MWKPLQPIRPDERRETLAAFLTLFLIMAGHALIETARDALFLSSITPQRLPWVYLCIAAAALVITWLQRGAISRMSGRVALGMWLIVSALVTVVFWYLVGEGFRWALFGVYIWSGVFTTIVLARFWILSGDLFTVTQAKRLFPLIGAGSVLGAIAGSAMARSLSTHMADRNLLLAGAIVLAIAALAPLLLPSGGLRLGWSGGAGLSLAEWREDLRRLTRHSYLRRVGLLVLVSTITLTIVDYIFKSAVAENVAPGEMAKFFSTVYLALNSLSLVVQVVLAGLIIRVMGVSRALIIMPMFLIAGAFGVLVGGGLVAALVLKFADGGLRHSLHRTAVETLYVPLSPEVRARLKGFVDAGGQRGGQALASLAILAILTLGGGVELLSTLVIVMGVAWIILALELRPHYLDLFRATLSEDEIRTNFTLPVLDVAALETLMTSLNSADDGEVLATLDLLAEQDRVRLVPALILYHPSSAVVLRSLDLFGKWGRHDWIRMLPRLLDNPDPEIRAAALRSSSAVDPDQSILMREFLDDEAAEVRATALVGLVSAGWLVGDDARRALDGIARGASKDEKIALARAIGHQPDDVFVRVLLDMADDADLDTRVEVARAMDEVGSPEFLPVLLKMLAQRRLRPIARSAMVRMGEETLEFLGAALADPQLEHGIRRHLPRTISRFGGDEAATILLDQLLDEEDGMVRYKILRGLGRLRANDPSIPLDEETLQRATEETLTATCRLLEWRTILEEGALEDPSRDTAVHRLLVELLRHKEEHSLERLFRLLGLQYSVEDIQSIYRGLRSNKREVVAGSRELLEHLLPPPIRDAVLSLVDDLPSSQRLAGTRGYYESRGGDYESVLRELMESGSETLVSLSAYHVGELGLSTLEPRLFELRQEPSPLVAEVIENALQLMQTPIKERLRYE